MVVLLLGIRFTGIRQLLGPTSQDRILTNRTITTGRLQPLIYGILLVISSSFVLPAWAVLSSDSLMPLTTRGYLSIKDINILSINWQQTQLGQLIQDESMRPFVQDLKRQLQSKLTSVHDKLGLELGDLKSIASGEIGLGIVERKNDRAAMILTVNVTGRMSQTEELLRQVDRELKRRGAKQSQADSSGTTFVSYDIPPQHDGDVQREAVFFIKDNMLCASDNRFELEEVCRRFGNQPGNRFQEAKPYQETMHRCAKEANGLQPELRWFVDPFGYARACRTLRRTDRKQYGKDYLKILTAQGFDAIQGVGGFLNVESSGTYEFLHRTAVYAPHQIAHREGGTPNGDGPNGSGSQDKYQLAMRMLNFPNGLNLAPQTWLPRKLATYRTFNINLADAFYHFGTLFDAIAGYEEAFDGVLEGLEKDPYGPQVDVEKDLIAHLDNRITMVTDYEIPITTKSERFLFMVKIQNEEAIQATIEKFMKSDPNAYRREFEGTVIWEIIEADDEMLELDISISPLEPLAPVGEQPQQQEDDEPVMPTSAVCVTNGHLLIASHYNFLKAVLAKEQIDGTLSDASDYREVNLALSQLISGPVSFRCFLRTDEAYRPTYELLRQGKMPESETLLGRMLNRMLTPPEDEDEGILRKQKIDGRELPSFEMVRRYFGPAGLIVRSEEDGWFIAGATLNKQAPQARAGVAAPADQSAIR
jgi:hypothetical protein